MKKNKKKSKKNKKKTTKRFKKKKLFKKKVKVKRKKIKKIKKIKRKKIKKNNYLNIIKENQSDGFILKIIRFQERIKSKLSFKFNIDFLYLDKKIQSFFEKIDNKLEEYRVTQAAEKRRIKIKEIERLKREKENIERNKKADEELQFKLKQKHLKEEERVYGRWELP